MSNIKTGTGVTLAIGTTAAATNQAQFEADTYTEVGDVEEIQEFGDARNPVTFAALADGRVRKARGTADAGDVTIIYAHQTGDGGQDAIKTAFEVTSQAADEFNFRIQLNDSEGVSPTTFYFRAKVMSRRVQAITNDGVIRVAAMLSINSAVIEVAAA